MIGKEPRIRNEDLGSSEISDPLEGDLMPLKVYHQILGVAKFIDDVHTMISPRPPSKDYDYYDYP